MEWPRQPRSFWVIDSDGHEPTFTIRELLSTMLERAVSASQATGGAIALSAGKELVCWASLGRAPGVGTHFVPSFGFSGRCVKKGRILQCDDSEIDPRVDRVACRQLCARSMIAAPLSDRGKTFGILELLSSNTCAFDDNDIRELSRVAESIVEVLAERRPPHKKQLLCGSLMSF